MIYKGREYNTTDTYLDSDGCEVQVTEVHAAHLRLSNGEVSAEHLTILPPLHKPIKGDMYRIEYKDDTFIALYGEVGFIVVNICVECLGVEQVQILTHWRAS